MVEAGGRVLGYPSRVSRRTFLGRTLVWSAALGGSGVAAWVLNPAFAAFESTLGPVAGARRRIIDVTQPPYRARGDGLANDAPAIQAAMDDAASAGGGIVYLPAGTYQLDSIHDQAAVRYYVLNSHSGVSLVGAGRDRTLLRAPAGMPDQTRIISADSADGQSRVAGAAFRDFTIDGRASLQPDARSCVGISNVYTDYVSHLRVRIVGVKGLPDAEGTCFDSFYSTNTVYRDCEVVHRPSESTGSGFSATQSEQISYEGCASAGSAHWHGFTSYLSQGIQYVDCHGYLNRQRGMNSESSSDVRYVNCLAGGDAMGNRGDGIFVFKSRNIEIIDCTSRSNQSGLVNVGSNVRVLRGQFVGNSRAGVSVGSMVDWGNTSMDEEPEVDGNGFASVAVDGSPIA